MAMTLLVASVMRDNAAAAAEAAGEALTRRADAVEIRLDGWDEDAAASESLAGVLPPGRWIATCRPTSEGGRFQGDTMQRVGRLLEAIACGAGYVDFEFADWRRSADIRQKIRLAAARRGAGEGQEPGLILSCHDFDARPQKPAAILAEMAAQPGVAAVKLAWRAENIVDNFVALDLLRQATVPTVALCMGEGGLLSRAGPGDGAGAGHAFRDARPIPMALDRLIHAVVRRYRGPGGPLNEPDAVQRLF